MGMLIKDIADLIRLSEDNIKISDYLLSKSILSAFTLIIDFSVNYNWNNE